MVPDEPAAPAPTTPMNVMDDDETRKQLAGVVAVGVMVLIALLLLFRLLKLGGKFVTAFLKLLPFLMLYTLVSDYIFLFFRLFGPSWLKLGGISRETSSVWLNAGLSLYEYATGLSGALSGALSVAT